MKKARIVLDLAPSSYLAHLVTAVSLSRARHAAEAIAAQRLATELSSGLAAMLGWLGLMLAIGGTSAEARTLLKRLHERAADAYVPLGSIGWIHLGLGEIDYVFECIDRAVEAHDLLIMPIQSYTI